MPTSSSLPTCYVIYFIIHELQLWIFPAASVKGVTLYVADCIIDLECFLNRMFFLVQFSYLSGLETDTAMYRLIDRSC